MSTKNLSRTAIEGGRVGRNTWERRDSHNSERASARDFCEKVKYDPDAADELFIKEKIKVYKEFDDKLGPMYRWLGRQVGKSWDKVRSEITKTFDTRTTAGRHIVNDHLLQSVEVTPNPRMAFYRRTGDDNTSYYKHDFYVNGDGILCQRKYIPRRSRRQNIPAWNTNQLANWLSGRVVGKVGNKYFWYIPADRSQKHHHPARNWVTGWGNYTGAYGDYGLTFMYLADAPIYKLDNMGRKEKNNEGAPIILGYEPQWVVDSPGTFRQSYKLDSKELEYWTSVPEYYQNKILQLSPNHTIPAGQDSYRYGY